VWVNTEDWWMTIGGPQLCIESFELRLPFIVQGKSKRLTDAQSREILNVSHSILNIRNQTRELTVVDICEHDELSNMRNSG
jgi:hypothetical protein